MHRVEELIKYHHECDFLDFKQEEYNEQNKPNLIKDVLAFANANVAGDKYIIIGVKKTNEITLFNIQSKWDSAQLQQYITKNITPDISIDYFPYQYKGHNLMILRINDPQAQPYFTKKQVTFKNGQALLKEHECWIRKGSYQIPASREDFEQMYAERFQTHYFNGEVNLYFEGTSKSEIELPAVALPELPSEIAAREIQSIIEKKKKEPPQADTSSFTPRYIGSTLLMDFPFQSNRNEDKTIDELNELLQTVNDDHLVEDLHVIFEKHSHLINFDIHNAGNRYIEDASVRIEIPQIDGLAIADEIFRKVEKDESPFKISTPSFSTHDELNYPDIKKTKSSYIIKEDIGNVKHHQPIRIVPVALRVYLDPRIKGKTIPIKCLLYARNLKDPLHKTLKIMVI